MTTPAASRPWAAGLAHWRTVRGTGDVPCSSETCRIHRVAGRNHSRASTDGGSRPRRVHRKNRCGGEGGLPGLTCKLNPATFALPGNPPWRRPVRTAAAAHPSVVGRNSRTAAPQAIAGARKAPPRPRTGRPSGDCPQRKRRWPGSGSWGRRHRPPGSRSRR